MIKKALLSLLCVFSLHCSSEKIEITQKVSKSIEPNPDTCYSKIEKESWKDVYSNENRLQILLGAKSSPIFYLEKPKLTEHGKVNKLRKAFEKVNPWTFIPKNKDYFKSNTDIARALFLRDNYFYHNTPYLAESMAQMISVNMLFSSDNIYITRGGVTMKAIRKGGSYFFSEGIFKEQEVSILINDHISEELHNEFLHVDFSELMSEIGFTKIEPKKYNQQHILTDMYFGNNKIQVLHKRNADVICYDGFINKEPRSKKIKSLQHSILLNTIDALPFDEPRHEYGQQDGELRNQWKRAYFNKKDFFVFNSDTYNVFTSYGKPKPPQVCVDFIIDSIERAGGTWFSNRNEKPQRITKLDMSELIDTESYSLRNVDGFKALVENNPNLFEILNIPKKVELGSSDFISFINSLKLKIGDIVLITGRVPWDKLKTHSHSFFIFDIDPITGLPITIAGNAGPAAIRPWKMETNRTPHRYPFMIVRPKEDLINKFEDYSSYILPR